MSKIENYSWMSLLSYTALYIWYTIRKLQERSIYKVEMENKDENIETSM